MSAAIIAEGVSVRFLFDRYRRVVTPAMARLRGHVTETWGLQEVSFSITLGEGVA